MSSMDSIKLESRQKTLGKQPNDAKEQMNVTSLTVMNIISNRCEVQKNLPMLTQSERGMTKKLKTVYKM